MTIYIYSYLVLIVRYQRVYVNTCWYDEFCEKVQVRNNVY